MVAVYSRGAEKSRMRPRIRPGRRGAGLDSGSFPCRRIICRAKKTLPAQNKSRRDRV